MKTRSAKPYSFKRPKQDPESPRYNNEDHPVFTKLPPSWDDEIVIYTRPTPQNQSTAQVKRRNHAASKHQDKVQLLLEDDAKAIVYTDAANNDHGTAIFHYCANNQKQFAAFLDCTTSVKEAELQASKKAIESVKQDHQKLNIHVYRL